MRRQPTPNRRTPTLPHLEPGPRPQSRRAENAPGRAHPARPARAPKGPNRTAARRGTGDRQQGNQPDSASGGIKPDSVSLEYSPPTSRGDSSRSGWFEWTALESGNCVNKSPKPRSAGQAGKKPSTAQAGEGGEVPRGPLPARFFGQALSQVNEQPSAPSPCGLACRTKKPPKAACRRFPEARATKRPRWFSKPWRQATGQPNPQQNTPAHASCVSPV